MKSQPFVKWRLPRHNNFSCVCIFVTQSKGNMFWASSIILRRRIFSGLLYCRCVVNCSWEGVLPGRRTILKSPFVNPYSFHQHFWRRKLICFLVLKVTSGIAKWAVVTYFGWINFTLLDCVIWLLKWANHCGAVYAPSWLLKVIFEFSPFLTVFAEHSTRFCAEILGELISNFFAFWQKLRSG